MKGTYVSVSAMHMPAIITVYSKKYLIAII